MKVLDASFLIDYLRGAPDTGTYYEDNGGPDEHWIIPAPAQAEVLVGIGNHPSGDIDEAINALSWGKIVETDEDTAVTAARIADEIGPEGPYLDGIHAIVAAVGREMDAPVVTSDGDLTHEATKHVIHVEEYRE